MVIPILFSDFRKLLLYQTNVKKIPNPSDLASATGIPPFSMKDYENAARLFTVQKTATIISYLREYDVKSKGVDSTASVEGGDLLKELVFKILH
jgi:DNA polymerase-3 subunit delta